MSCGKYAPFKNYKLMISFDVIDIYFNRSAFKVLSGTIAYRFLLSKSNVSRLSHMPESQLIFSHRLSAKAILTVLL